MSLWWLTIALGISLVFCARPSATSFADGSDGLWDHQHRRASPSHLFRRSRHRIRSHEPEGEHGETKTEGDPDGRAEAMMAACQKTKHDEIKLKEIRKCVEALQSYAQDTRQGFISSISAEKVFVREYQNAAKKLAMLGDTELFWNDIQKEHKNALVFLTDLASKVGEDAKDLKVYTKLKKKREAKKTEGSGEDEDDDDEDDKDEDSEGDTSETSKGEDENEEEEEMDEKDEKDEKDDKEEGEAKEEKEDKEGKEEKGEKEEAKEDKEGKEEKGEKEEAKEGKEGKEEKDEKEETKEDKEGKEEKDEKEEAKEDKEGKEEKDEKEEAKEEKDEKQDKEKDEKET